MKSLTGVAFGLLLLLNCSGDSPTAPSARPNPNPNPPDTSQVGFVSGFAHDSSGVCVAGAVVEMLDGPRAGATVTQANPCGAVWDIDGGYSFRDLPMGANVRMRASKKGYQSREMTFSTSGSGQSNFLLLPE